MAGETSHTDVTHKRGSLDFFKLQQRYAYSGDDLAVSGGESQRLQSSDVSWLSPNAATEISNTGKVSLRGLQLNLTSGLLSGLGQNSRVSCNPLTGKMSLDVSVAACALGQVFGYTTTDLSAIRLPDRAIPVFGAASLLGPDQALNVRQPSFPFNLFARRLATQPTLRPEYSNFSWSALRGRVSTPLLPFSRPQMGGYLGLGGFTAPSSLAQAQDSAALRQSLCALGGLIVFNLGEEGCLLLPSSQVSLMGYHGDLTHIPSEALAAQDLCGGVAPLRLDVEVPSYSLGIIPPQRAAAFFRGWGPEKETCAVSVELALVTPFHQIALIKFTRLELELLTFEEGLGGLDRHNESCTVGTYQAALLSLHQIMLAKFIRLELEALLPDRESQTPPARVKPIFGLHSLPAYSAFISFISAVCSLGLGLLDRMFMGLIYVPAYLHVTFVSSFFSTLRSFLDSVEEVYFLTNLGLLWVLGLVPDHGVTCVTTVEPTDWTLFFAVEPLSVELRSLHVGIVGFTTLA